MTNSINEMDQARIVPDYSRETALRDVLDDLQNDFPVIVRTCDSCEVYERVGKEASSLPARALIKLEKVTRVPYALVKVLPLPDEEKARTERGDEHVDGYYKLVDEEFLIPLNIPHKVSIVHRPHRRRRYAVVEQILQDKPRYVRVETDTWSSPSPGHEEQRHIPAGTVLEVKSVLPKQYENTDYLECEHTESKHKYIFRGDDKVNFTAVLDTKTYSLSELVSSVLLPVVIKFADTVELKDVVLFDGNQAMDILTITYGVLEVIRRESRSFAVGLLQDKIPNNRSGHGNEAVQQVVLIPEASFHSVEVQMKNFPTDNQKLQFCGREFKNFKQLDFVYRKLYNVLPDKEDCVFLCSDEDAEDLLKPVYDAPPVPPRSWRQSAGIPQVPTDEPQPPKNKNLSDKQFGSQKNIRQDVLKKILDRTKLGFEKVHKELLANVQKSKNFLKSSNFTSPFKSKLAGATSAEDFQLRKPTKHEVEKRSVSESAADWFYDKDLYKDRPLPPVPFPSDTGDPKRVTSDGYLILSKVDAARDGKKWV